MRRSFRQLEKYRNAKLSAEKARVRPADARLKVCLVFPNSYHVGMSNLAVHCLYAVINSRKDACCERSFFEEPLTGYSLETASSLADFDVLAFSVSFELDYPKILKILNAARIPLRSNQRSADHPLIIAGGPCVFSNPEPIADFFDLLAVGEGEEMIGDILDLYSRTGRRSRSRDELLRQLSEVPGIYVPSFYQPVYDAGGFLKKMNRNEGPALPVSARVVEDLDRHPCASVILTPNTEFANMFLIELGRGCRRGCKFCSACYTYFRRNRSADSIIQQIEEAQTLTDRVGLVTSDLSDYPHRERLLHYLMKKQLAFSVSSIRADAITEDILAGMRRSRQRTLTVAPEVASEKLMSITGKRISSDVLLGAVQRALQQGILSFKLYFMIGFPEEDEDDIHAIIELASRVLKAMQESAKETHKIGKLTISINPFIPKPFTPMEAEPFLNEAPLMRRIRLLRIGIGRLGNTSLLVESPRTARLQCAFARGDRRVGALIESAAGDRSVAQLSRDYGKIIEEFAGAQPEDAMCPWHVIAPPSTQKKPARKVSIE
ncbi:MAG: radical SAM protein [Candidatus Abyssobacteria bacterium SURF_5]|uniref:Radical SAM protein n=1 Tax=Abyssobacteria bacterium (strain SURF_5) TaxID=2093360 RepID=A0A3A4N9D1_ABYX5|nr:MAG: radical SAM protein [Candidatus Abyssubacteria bacterium SURF_5]